jgi:uncharacterized membrane-anchored protein
MGERRALAAGAAGILCLTVLTWMLVSHAWPVWTGETIYLRARPVDPRDLFRGDYVVLAYEIDSVVLVDPDARAAEELPHEDVEEDADVSEPPAQPPPDVRPVGDWWRPDERDDGDE